MKTYLEKIEERAASVKNIGRDFMDTCSIFYKNPNRPGSSVVILMPTLYHWGAPVSENSQSLQLLALKELKAFIHDFNILLPQFTSNQVEQIQESQQALVKLLEKRIDAPSSIDRAKEFISEEIDKHVWLTSLLKTSDSNVLVIPDTNSIVANPDPNDYKQLAGTDRFQFILTPTVTKELDELKISHRNDNFRNKVKSAIRRIKGYRKQGSLIDGVTYAKTIRIRAIANEPSFENLYSWLDRDNLDDRLIASVLEIIVANPNNHVLLVTGDINLQNKAELAQINYGEIE